MSDLDFFLQYYHAWSMYNSNTCILFLTYLLSMTHKTAPFGIPVHIE